LPKVFIVGPDGLIARMFRKFGWETVDTIQEADLVQFTGGSDVTPELYGAHNVYSYNDLARDRREAVAFQAARNLDKPMAGICRGGQFLNVMCGGSMWQDVDNHAGVSSHIAYDADTDEPFNVTSTHHQMMIEGPGAKLVAYAKLSTKRTKGGKLSDPKRSIHSTGLSERDVEALFYKTQMCFCFQPHPEYECPDLDSIYFGYLEEFFNIPSNPVE